MPRFPLIVGNILLDEAALEVPERLGDLGGRQVLEQHDFPGGTRTQQTYGWFPASVRWSGVLTGPFATVRMQQVKALGVNGTEVALTYGPYAWLGIVSAVAFNLRFQWYVPYTLSFEPRLDLTLQQQGGSTSESAEAQLSNQTSGLSSLLGGSPFAIPGGLGNPVQSLLTAVGSGLGNSGGLVSGLTPQATSLIEGAVATVQTTATSIMQSGSDQDQFMARSAYYRATKVGSICASPSTPQRQVTVINPNLPLLAAQYLGDASLWTEIADLNPPINSPQPPGQFTLLIPPSPTLVTA